MLFTKKFYKISIKTDLDGFYVDVFHTKSYENGCGVYFVDEKSREANIPNACMDRLLTDALNNPYPEIRVYTYDENEIDEYIDKAKKLIIEHLKCKIVYINELLSACEKDLKGELNDE